MIDFQPVQKNGNGFRIHTKNFLLFGVERTDLDESLSSPRIQSLVGRSLLIQGLKEMGVFHESPIYRYGEYKKPYLSNYPGLFFNIAHCVEAVVCALAKQEIGVDVEQIQILDPDVIEIILNEEEKKSVQISSDPDREFIRYWTLKESLLKYRGTGLTDDLKDLLICSSCQFNGYSGKNYEIAVCFSTEKRI